MYNDAVSPDPEIQQMERFDVHARSTLKDDLREAVNLISRSGVGREKLPDSGAVVDRMLHNIVQQAAE